MTSQEVERALHTALTFSNDLEPQLRALCWLTPDRGISSTVMSETGLKAGCGSFTGVVQTGDLERLVEIIIAGRGKCDVTITY